MTTSPLSIAFHIGVHKTATSHLQRCLGKARDALAADGVRFYGPDFFRAPGRTIPLSFGFQPDQDSAAHLAAMAQGGHRLILSEENYIGTLNNARGMSVKRRYKSTGARLSAFGQAVAQDFDVFIAVRRPTNFINSAYCQSLLGGQVRPVNVFLRRNPLSSVNWVDLVAQARAAGGVGRVFVWRYEDYADVFPQIVAALAGSAAHHIPHVQRRINAGLSSAAAAEVLHRNAQAPDAKAGYLARKMLPVRPDFPAFDGFLPEDHALSEVAYQTQMDAIAAMAGVTILQPDQG